MSQKPITNWVKELAAITGRTADSLSSHGLQAGDFPSETVVEIAWEDGSCAHFRYALLVSGDTEFRVFTEHCGYHVFVRPGCRARVIPESLLLLEGGPVNAFDTNGEWEWK